VPVCVLIVDDDPAFREAAGELLTARGFEVAGYAGDEDQAIVAVQRLRPDAVLLDIRLLGSNGLHLAQRISSADGAPAVLLTSSDPDIATQPLAVKYGAVGFVPKADLANTDLRHYFAA
jgi:two-component system chemotaxis response regulator CheY